MFFTGTDGCATMMELPEARRATGVKSLMGSKGIFA